jgi:hypothetical protein
MERVQSKARILSAWPIPREARDLAAEFLGGEVALRREWRASLRSDWIE